MSPREEARERASFDRYVAALRTAQARMIALGVPVAEAVDIAYDLAAAARDRGWDCAVLPLVSGKGES